MQLLEDRFADQLGDEETHRLRADFIFGIKEGTFRKASGEPADQLLNTVTGCGRDEHCAGAFRGEALAGPVIEQVRLVEDENDRRSWRGGESGGSLERRRSTGCRIGYVGDDVGVSDGDECRRAHRLLEGVLRLDQARRVENDHLRVGRGVDTDDTIAG